ncbi:UDP-glucosyltransferase 2-like isoform X2 [Ostrinia nubilalis]|uniref:UDP-glucosyltransferase 2-like isoform X1 n=1 Tax=Ostrinia nubilalis TaxID=29057 RepID=UPI003082511A
MRTTMLSALLLLLFASQAWSYNVLCIFPTPSKSHNHLGKGIVDALLDAGHQVTWGTPFPSKTSNKNLRMIDLSSTVALSADIDMTQPRFRNAGPDFLRSFARNISISALSSQELRDALTKQQFDAVVTEWFFSDYDCGYAAVQQAPWILLSGMTMHPHLEMLVDEVRSIQTHPLLFNDFPVPMTLWQRMINSFIFGMMTISNWRDQPDNDAYYQSAFGPLAKARGLSLPAYQDALHNVSILFVNTDPAVDRPRSVPANVISIAGYHIDANPGPLPKDLETILDSSSKGVIYFSMGSVLKSSAFPEHLIADLLKLFGELPYTVLWKFEKELTGAPKNVHVRAWFPQASILAHPNVKLFITHGGLLSTLEAANAGVPILAVPMFGDQPSNAARAVRAGVARKVDFSHHMADELRKELNEMLSNDSYLKTAQSVSKLFRKRPVAPSKLISHYVEVAIESKGAYHLRSPSKLYAWYERYMLDQLAIVGAILYLIVKLIKTAVSVIKRKVSGGKKQKRS